MTARIGIDIGGTFTDVVLVDAAGGVHVTKLLTDHEHPARAVLAGYEAIIAGAGVAPADVEQVCHGTTLVTNAVLERRGARTALVTTRGFRDVLEIATEDRYDMYDLGLEKPEHVVARQDVHELGERMLADGSVRTPLDDAELDALAEALRAGGHEAVAICLLHAYANPAHEIAVHERLGERLPGVAVTRSSDVSPELREYHRASTTALNAYVMPTLRGYLRAVEDGLAASGVPHALSLMLSNGGLCTSDVAMDYPVRLIESGPAAGALAAAEVARATGHAGVISFDVGGTTAKACLIVDGEPLFTQGLEVARQYRFKAGSGLPLQVRSVDLIEIAGGGGSIASVDALGLVQVGPESASSAPGPACYGRGGDRPTVTDADLVLGYLDAAYFLGGTMPLDLEAARRALAERIGAATGRDAVEAAHTVRRVVDEQMASAIRMYALEHGHDPSRFPLVAFGGAGPVHAVSVARILGAPRVIVPAGAGVSSAHGLLVAPLSFDFVRSAPSLLAAVDWAWADEQLRAMEADGRAILERAGVAPEAVQLRRLCDLRFHGQGAELPVDLPPGAVGPATEAALAAAFAARYSALYRHVPGDVPVEVIAWRVVASSVRPTSDMAPAPAPADAVKGARRVWWGPQDGELETTVLDRGALGPGARFDGPLIVEERESTTVVDPRCTLTIDDRMNLVIDLH
ncbi:MAG TPA: hydantoinase/oxoprolinase family protein [Solirubrobacter sp.]|nr:hydantoinase/oxoprolinase family protein [Solirubrobacter sp.]